MFAIYSIWNLGRTGTWVAPVCPLIALLLLLGAFARAEDSQFIFDATGNLALQKGEISAPPQILAQPQPQIVVPGALASFVVVVANPQNLAYQWQFDGASIPGATNDTLVIQNASAAEAGEYSVVLSNAAGSVTSAPASLLLDADRDSLPDSWEVAHFGDLGQRSGGDFDGDGLSNREEFLDGTNPADSASMLFRLTVLSDGGQVTVSPSRFIFTNGESVTLTASAFAPNTFHGWTGATNSTSPTISLLMDANKTIFAHLDSYDITWTNSAGGDWNVRSNWSPNFVPGTNDNVIINRNVTITLNTDAEIGSLTLGSGATLTGGGTLTLQRSSVWSGGTLAGAGRLLILPDATMTIDGNMVLTGARILDNAGTTLWRAGSVQVGAGTVITNRLGALFLMQSAAQVTIGLSGGRIDNAGTIRKTSSSTNLINNPVSLNNYGLLDLASGTLALGGGGLNSGTIELSAGATLNFSAGTFTASAGSSIAGPGHLAVSGGTANLAGFVNVTGDHRFSAGVVNLTGNYICTNNTLTINGAANFNGTGVVSPSVLNLGNNGNLGGNNMVTVLGSMAWTGGTMSGPGRTVIPPGVTLTVNATSTSLSGGRILENGGTILWNAGNIQAASNTVITNRPGAFFLVQSAAQITTGLGGGQIDNAGTFRKTVAGSTTINNPASFNNYGVVELQSGTLTLGGGGINRSTIQAAQGTTLAFSAGTFTSSLDSSIGGEGHLVVSGGTLNLAGLVNLTGNHTFSGGTANLTGDYFCTNNTLAITATANFSGTGTVSPATLNLGNNGNLGGSQTVTVLGQMNWTGGNMTGLGRTIIPPGATLTINAGSTGLSGGRILENGGTTLWNAGSIQAASNTVITNRPGALFLVQSAAQVTTGLGAGRIDNAGIFRKTSAGTTTINGPAAFNNYGTVEMVSGILAANGGYTSRPDALLQVSLGGTTAGTGYGRLQVSGAVSLNGALGITFANGFIPTTNDTFTVLTSGTRNGAFTSFSYPSNVVSMQISNSATSVAVHATGRVADPDIRFLPSELTGADIRLNWTAVSNRTYRIEYKTDLNSTNWSALPGDVTSLGTNAVKLDSRTSSNRFYRVRLVP